MQLLMTGVSARDDPSGEKIIRQLMELRRSPEFADVKDQIKIARTPHNDLIRNFILKYAYLAMQPSIAEAWEHMVTEAIYHGTPVIGSNRGGIPLQIVEGESGYKLDPNDIDGMKAKIVNLCLNPAEYARLRERTADRARDTARLSTVRNVLGWVTLYRRLLRPQDADFPGNRRWAVDLAHLYR